MKMHLLISLLLFVPHALSQLTLPPLTGPHKVGTTTLYLPNAPRDIMISLFYPTSPTINTITYPLAPVYDPLYASFLERTANLPSGLASSLFSQAHLSAPLFSPTSHRRKKCDTPPVLIFSPGYGGSRLDYTATLSNLASEGYIVVGVDHPNDTAFIAYPDGRGVFFQPIELDEQSAADVVEKRVGDLLFVVSSLTAKDGKLAKKGLPGLEKALDGGKGLGILGHSIGGAAAASTILTSKTKLKNKNKVLLKCGANLDGSFWGPIISKGLPRNTDFLIMSSENRTRDNDPSWASFWKNSKGGLELEVKVVGAGHGSYSDQGYLLGVLVKLGVLEPGALGDGFGTIDGERMLDVEDAYLTAFFDHCLKGEKEKLLNGPSKLFPEVIFYSK